MMRSVLARLVHKTAAAPMIMRMGIVGANFLVMIGLASWLGLAVFGQLAFLWGLALIAGTIVSLGGPLILLRALTDGRGATPWQRMAFILIYPGGFAAAGSVVLTTIWPDLPWTAILFTAVSSNMMACLASVMRASGSVQLSMALRDAGPQMALGLAAVVAGPDAAGILAFTAVLMVIFSCGIALWCRGRHPAPVTQRTASLWDIHLWGTSVLGMAVAQMDLIIGGLVLSDTTLGFYALLRRVANLVALPVSVATWVSAASVSAAFGARDMRALAGASAAGSRIAMIPGFALFALGVSALPFLPDQEMRIVFAILLLGSLGQVFFAASYTVATLCGFARYAVLARFSAIGFYLTGAVAMGQALSAIGNALVFTTAMSLGSLLLWHALKRRIGIDTSAAVVWRRKAAEWHLS